MTTPAEQLLDDYVWILELAAATGATAVEGSGYEAPCPECEQRVPTYLFRVEMDYGRGSVWPWQRARPQAHRRECWFAAKERADASFARMKAEGTLPDLWGAAS